MSNQDFIDDPDANRWSNVPKPTPEETGQPGTPIEPVVPDADRWSNLPKPAPQEPVQPETPTEPVSPEPVIYDPERDEHEPYVDVTPDKDGFESVPPVTKDYSYTQPPVEKKKTSGWIIALIVLLVLCICAVVAVVVAGFFVISGQYRIEWSMLTPLLSYL
jgi:hypothetical protein